MSPDYTPADAPLSSPEMDYHPLHDPEIHPVIADEILRLETLVDRMREEMDQLRQLVAAELLRTGDRVYWAGSRTTEVPYVGPPGFETVGQIHAPRPLAPVLVQNMGRGQIRAGMGSWTPGSTSQAQRYGAPRIRAYNMLRPELSALASTMRRFHPYSAMGNGPLIGPQERVIRGRQLMGERMIPHVSPGPSTRRMQERHPSASMRGAADGLPPTCLYKILPKN